VTRGEWVVRSAQPGDVSSIVHLHRELERVHRTAHPELYQERDETADVAAVEQSLRDPKVGIFVAQRKAATVSFVHGMVRVVEARTPPGHTLAPRTFGLVDELFVSTSVRRERVATLLLDAAELWARSRGLPALEVTVWAFNLGAMSLYREQGFDMLRHYMRKTLDE